MNTSGKPSTLTYRPFIDKHITLPCIEALVLFSYNGVVVIKTLKTSLQKTRSRLKKTLDDILKSGRDREGMLDALAEGLLLSDAGIDTTEKIIQSLREQTRKTDSFVDIREALKKELISILSLDAPVPESRNNEMVMMFVGINGGGKTTSAAKLAHSYQQKGRDVLLVAADTFRAAAQEQLVLWGKTLNIPVIRGQYGADPASVVFDAVQSFKARKGDVMLIDTAGRIHTNINLMNELEKIKRVVSREIEGAPHEIFLVLDASIGRNALAQAKEFLKFSGLTGIILTKLDGTAKGGCVLSIVDDLGLPIRYIGIGEKENDLSPFSAEEFTRAFIS